MDVYQVSNIPLFHQKIGKSRILIQDYEQTDLEHRKLLEAIKKKNFKHAKETLLKHLHRGAESMIE